MKITTTTAGETAKIIAALIVVCGLMFVSCKKNRTCTCTTTTTSTYTSGTVTIVDVSTSTSKSNYKKVTKKDSQLFCSSGTSSETDNSGSNSSTSTTDCKLD